jgi:hypothetical protein
MLGQRLASAVAAANPGHSPVIPNQLLDHDSLSHLRPRSYGRLEQDLIQQVAARGDRLGDAVSGRRTSADRELAEVEGDAFDWRATGGTYLVQ